jgi:hypothetical protein
MNPNIRSRQSTQRGQTTTGIRQPRVDVTCDTPPVIFWLGAILVTSNIFLILRTSKIVTDPEIVRLQQGLPVTLKEVRAIKSRSTLQDILAVCGLQEDVGSPQRSGSGVDSE